VDKEIPVRLGGMNRERPVKKKKPKPAAAEEGNDEEEPHKKRKYLSEYVLGLTVRRKGKRKARSVSPDPWARLAKAVPFNQPVQAPPTLTAPTRKLSSSLPNSLSAARKDVLEAERQDVIAKYRQRMGRS